MNARKQECRWRYVVPGTETAGEWTGDESAWATSCEQWCVAGGCAPSRDGFRNGFCFCPYCGGPLVLLLSKSEEAAA